MSDFSIGGFRIPLPDFGGNEPAAATPPASAPAPPAAPASGAALPPGRPGMHGPVGGASNEPHIPIDRKPPDALRDAIKEFDRSLEPRGRAQYRDFSAWQAKDGSWIATVKTPVGGDFLRGPRYGDVATYRFKDGVTKPLTAEDQTALDAEYKSRSHRDALESAKSGVIDLGREILNNIANPPPKPPPTSGDLPFSLHG